MNASQIREARTLARRAQRKAKEAQDAIADLDGFAFAYIGHEASSVVKRAREAAQLTHGLTIDAHRAVWVAVEAKKGKA